MSFESLYIGATGMTSYGTAMSNIGNNIANVNTTAYKSSSTLFANLFSDSIVTGGGTSQTGHGVSVADIVTNYNVGTITSTEDVLDMAINGKGYFAVEKDGDTLYTRAGNFRFNADGYLVDPNGYVLQGKEITSDGLSATQDVRLDLGEDGTITMTPQATSSISLISNLGTYTDKTTSATNPYFSLLQAWDGTSETPLGDSAYAFSQEISVYDENGDAHTLTVYYDGAESDNGTVWEYIVTMDPSEDGSSSASGAGAGLLMSGTLTFSSAGELQNMTAYTLNAGTAGSDTQSLSNWGLTSFDADGLPVFSATFLADDGTTSTNSISLNLGISSSTGTWSAASGDTAATTYGSNASLPTMNGVTIDNLVTTAYSGSASTTVMSQDGWTDGQLTSLSIGNDGIVVGNYTNGESQELYQLTLYLFTNQYGLESEGGNLYRATAESGEAFEGVPEEGARGSIQSSALENSNVDLASEFVSMITTQRAFQANSKVITTSDEMLKKAMEIKR